MSSTQKKFKKKPRSRSGNRFLLLVNGEIVNCCHTTVQEHRRNILYAGTLRDCERLKEQPELVKAIDKLSKALVKGFGVEKKTSFTAPKHSELSKKSFVRKWNKRVEKKITKKLKATI